MKKEQIEKQAIKTINEKMSEQLQRVKCNYRASLTSKDAIINESRKTISAAYRTGIKSLLINKMSDVNVDLLNITFFRRAFKDDGVNFDTIPEKFTMVRNGEYIQCSIDNYLTCDEKLQHTTAVVLSIWTTDVETFESVSQNIRIDIPFNSNNDITPTPNIVLDFIFNELIIEF